MLSGAVPRPVSNPPNPFESTHLEWLEDTPEVHTEVFEEEAKSILARNESPDIPFRFSVNPYRGCAHACAYCYARVSHQYLGFGAGTDFDSRIVVKVNAATLLRHELRKRSWSREPIAFSGNTDCYQPLEASYELTRACLRVCRDFENPVQIVTKGTLIRRDVDLLAELHERAAVRVYVSIPFLDESIGRAVEPGAPSPARRLDTMRRLAEAGIPVGLALAPLIPGLNDADLPRIVEAAAKAGATEVFAILLRLPAEVQPVFEERLRAAFPDRADRVLSACRQSREGQRSSSAFGERMRGAGPRWEILWRMLEVAARRHGLRLSDREIPMVAPPRSGRQGELFGGA